MSWASVMALCFGAFGLKAAGVLLADRLDEQRAERFSLELLAVPVLAGLIVVQTLDGGHRHLVFDARAPALLVAALLLWRRAPLLIVALAAAATAALLRLF